MPLILLILLKPALSLPLSQNRCFTFHLLHCVPALVLITHQKTRPFRRMIKSISESVMMMSSFVPRTLMAFSSTYYSATQQNDEHLSLCVLHLIAHSHIYNILKLQKHPAAFKRLQALMKLDLSSCLLQFHQSVPSINIIEV